MLHSLVAARFLGRRARAERKVHRTTAWRRSILLLQTRLLKDSRIVLAPPQPWLEKQTSKQRRGEREKKKKKEKQNMEPIITLARSAMEFVSGMVLTLTYFWLFSPCSSFRELILHGCASDQEVYGANGFACWPGVLISTFCIGSLLMLTFPYNWDWKTSLLLGGLLGATDPMAVVALLKELGASKKLTTIIDGESVMNDGVSVVVFKLFFKMVMRHSSDWGSIIKFLAQNSFGAVGIGLAFGIASVLWLRFVFNDTVVQITVTLSVSYFAYYTAQEWAGVSGILTVMTLGMFFAAFARTAFKADSHQSLHHFWEMVAYIANTLVFVLSGVIIAEGILCNQKISYEGNSWGFLFLLYLYVQLSRCVVVGVLYPLLRRFGYGLDWRESIILTWSGLRGAVSLSLALSVKL